MKQPTVQPKNIEATFGVDELFFSTTDVKGMIRSGNEVFVRLSKYPVEELLGAPHSIIRHPDMPKAVFKLLWDYLLTGRAIGAYVKNLSRDGSYYWVFALVTPLPDGFLSVRLKPTSSIFPIVEKLYSKLRKIEIESGDRGEAGKEAMKVAGEQLLEALKSLGFASYDEFMYAALQAELTSRDALLKEEASKEAYTTHPQALERSSAKHARILGVFNTINRKLNALYQEIGSFLSLSDMLDRKTSYLEGVSENFRYVAINTAIESAKLGDRGASLGVIATHLGESSQKIEVASGDFFEHVGQASLALKSNAFMLGMARLQAEIAAYFCNELVHSELNGGGSSADSSAQNTQYRQHPDAMIQDLTTTLLATLESIVPSLAQLNSDLGELDYHSEELRKAILTLRFAQLGGIIESTRIDVGNTFTSLFEEIESQIEDAKQEFQELSRSMHNIATNIELIPARVKEIVGTLQ